MDKKVDALYKPNNGYNIINESEKNLIPWWSNENEDILKNQTESDPESYLNGFYLFSLPEIMINSNSDDVTSFINQRFQVLLSAANTSQISIMLLISSRNGKTEVYIGLKKESPDKKDNKLFESILNGIIPGKKIQYNEKVKVSTLVNNLKVGGMITGIPTLKNDNEKQKFNISSIVRSLYGKDYLFAIISKPLSDVEKKNSFSELISVRDNLHTLTKMTIGEEKGTGESYSESEQKTEGKSHTSGHSFGGTVGIGIPTKFGFIGGGGVNYSRNWSDTTSESITKGTTKTSSQNKSQSLSIEQQNGFALELEKISNQYIQRMIKGFNSGLWETSITFAANDKIDCEVLGGTFIGELSKPHEKLLPPSRLYIDSLEQKKILFLPKVNSSNLIFPKTLASYVTSEELSQISSPPTESIPGYEIKKMPALALTDFSEGDYELGNITDHGNSIENSFISLSKLDLNKHLFVCGITGSGKTTTIKHILKNISRKDSIPFLVLESAKRDYRQLLADETFKNNLNIFTIGDATVSPIRFNPFYIQSGVHPLVHIDHLKAIFNASFSLYGPMPHILEKCLHSIYKKRGWNLTTKLHSNFIDKKGEPDEKRYGLPEHHYCFPTLSDLKYEVDNYVKKELGYKGELQDNIRTAIIARIDSLSVGAKGLMFNTHDFYPMEDLLNTNTIFEMENLADDDDKAFFVGLILVLISEFRQRDNPAINPGNENKGLKHLLVIEEAHRLLRNVNTERTSEMMGNPKGKAVEVFCNVISEMRSLGQGVAVVEQIPSKISPDVIKNSNTKIVHRIVSKDDQSLLAGSLSISDEDALYLNRLETGHALCHKEGMERPVEFRVSNDVKSFAISDDKVHDIMEKIEFNPLHNYETYELVDLLKDEGREIVIQFLNSICTVGFENFEKLRCTLFEKLKKKSLEKSGQHFDEKDYEDYTVKCIMEILSKGIYYHRSNFPESIKSILEDLFIKKDSELLKKVLKKLEEYWEENPSDFVNKIVLNLAIKFIASNSLPNRFNQDYIYKTVEEFFLLPANLSIQQICDNVNNHFGERK